MSITPDSPAINQQGWVQTWVTSQWKNRPIPGQFSAEINIVGVALLVSTRFIDRSTGRGRSKSASPSLRFRRTGCSAETRLSY